MKRIRCHTPNQENDPDSRVGVWKITFQPNKNGDSRFVNLLMIPITWDFSPNITQDTGNLT